MFFFSSFEPPGGFDLPIAYTNGPVKIKSLSYFKLNPLRCGTGRRAFSRFFRQLKQTALFISIDPRCILELLVDISATIEQRIFVIAPARAFV